MINKYFDDFGRKTYVAECDECGDEITDFFYTIDFDHDMLCRECVLKKVEEFFEDDDAVSIKIEKRSASEKIEDFKFEEDFNGYY